MLLLMVKRNPVNSPVEVGSLSMFIPSFTGFLTSQVVQEFFHQPYHFLLSGALHVVHSPLFSRWWFQTFFIFIQIPGEMIHDLTNIFFKWVGSTTNQFS